MTKITKGCGPNKGAKTAAFWPASRSRKRGFPATLVEHRARLTAFKLTNRACRGALVVEIQLTRAGSIVIGRPDPMFLPRGV
jgi:hypothetical protein